MVMKELKRRLFGWMLVYCLIPALCMNGPSLSMVWAQEDPAAPAPLPAEQLDELVAPIALYPDGLVAQVLAGSTYPSQITEAEQWLASYPGLTGDRLAAAVDTQPWDPSVKALTQFPSVVAKMSNNLSWTSALGEAYYYQPQDVLNAVQVMRQRAMAARTLLTTPQQQVIVEDGTVVILPANPETVYVPAYNPATAYGAPVPVYPGYSGSDLLLAGVLGFGAGVLVGVLADSFAWRWNDWNTDWHHHAVFYQNNVYVSRTPVFYGGSHYGGSRPVTWSRPAANAHSEVARQSYGPSGGERPAGAAPEERAAEANRNPVGANRDVGNERAAGERATAPAARESSKPSESAFRGYGKAAAAPAHSTAFSGIAPGGEARLASARGRTSFHASARPATHTATHKASGGGSAHGGTADHKH
jgi:uncharacterized protein DUF3300